MVRPFAIVLAALVGMASSATSSAQTADFDDTLSRLGITLPDSVMQSESVRRPLDELHRERCDQTAISALGEGLQKVGRRREAATALISFSKACGGHASSVRRAVNILLQLNDHAAVIGGATELIKLEPYADNGYFLRALGHERSGEYKKAIDDYATAIELFGNKEKIASVGYFNMARSYEKLGQFCDALVPIEAWVALDPARNDTSQTRAMLADLSAKGNCGSTATTGEAVVPIGRSGQTVIVSASINGVSGRFVLDTGATFVSLKRSFADRAKVEVDEGSSTKLHTANGISEGQRGRAKTMALSKLVAQNVPIIVQTDDRATYGPKIDGLLGMSFLSRFDMTIDAKSVRLKPRSRR
jgi:clan AA aspartic protease (TIGR02281 family)